MSFDTKAIAEMLGEQTKGQIDEAVKVITVKHESELKSIEDELKEIKLKQKETGETKKFDEASAQEIMAKTFKGLAQEPMVSEAKFKEMFKANCKATYNNETIATEGAEFVFAQFESDVLRVIQNFQLAKEVKIYSVKGTELNIPKALNNVVTSWKAEGANYDKSKGGSAFVTINIGKATTLVPFSEELLDDNMTTPDYYRLVVEWIGESQAGFIENEMINGTGDIEGILTNADVNVQSAEAGAITLKDMSFDAVDKAINSAEAQIELKYQKRPDADIVLMSKYVLLQLRSKKLTTGAYAYPEIQGKSPTLKGKRVVLSDKAPMQNEAQDIAGATFLVMGEFKTHYLVAKSGALKLTRGYADGDFIADLQSVKGRTRLGGAVAYGEAFAKCLTAAV